MKHLNHSQTQDIHILFLPVWLQPGGPVWHRIPLSRPKVNPDQSCPSWQALGRNMNDHSLSLASFHAFLLLLWHIRSANICWITFWVPGAVLFPGESEMNQTEHQTSWCSKSAGELGPKSLALIKCHQAQKWKWLILLLACVEIGSRVNWGNAWEDSPRALIDELPRK